MTNFAADDDAAERSLGSASRPPPQRQPVRGPQHSRTDSSCTAVESQGQEQTKFDHNKFMEEECRSFDHYLEEPSGWPQLAAMPSYFINTDVLRTFNPLGMRLIFYRGVRLAFLQSELTRFDKEENTYLKSLTEYQKRLPWDSKDKGKLDVLIAEIEMEYQAYTDLVRRYTEMSCDKEKSQLHRVPSAHFGDVLNYLGSKLEGDSLLWFNSPEEAACISTPLPNSMDWLVHTPPVGWLINRLIGPEGSKFVRRSHLVLIHKMLITLGALAVLVPIGIMFLCDLTKAQSFGVVLCFSVLFSLSITLTQDVDSKNAWLVVCAFSAVLVTVMVQLVPATSQK